jgi:hypothetical protein
MQERVWKYWWTCEIYEHKTKDNPHSDDGYDHEEEEEDCDINVAGSYCAAAK